MTLKEAVRRHTSSTGSGFELDDVMSGGQYPKEVVDGIYEISSRYCTPEYPVGIANPASFEELRLLAEQYCETTR